MAGRRGLGVASGRRAAAAGAAISHGACAALAAFSATASVASRATTTTGEEPNSSRVNSAVRTSGAALASTDTAGDGTCVSGAAGGRRAPPTAWVGEVALVVPGSVSIPVHAGTMATAAHSPTASAGVLSFGDHGLERRRGPERTRLPGQCLRRMLVGLATVCGLSHRP